MTTITTTGSVSKNKDGQYEVTLKVGPFKQERDAIRVADALDNAINGALYEIEEALKK